MNPILEFVLERYNYWIVIILMMTGLYIVFARGNLVKKIVGLNLFQTSVFIFYITIGKSAGGTAPIFLSGDGEHYGAAKADGADGALHDGYGEGAAQSIGQAAQSIGENGAGENPDAASLHSKVENMFGDISANDLKAAVNDLETGAVSANDAAPLHESADTGVKIANDALRQTDKADLAGFDIAAQEGASAHEAGEAGRAIADAASHAEIIYTNPLPHVLILTAIVVGVATTAVGLALAVRIREAYGTIEEDELEAIDNIAEFGSDAARTGGAA